MLINRFGGERLCSLCSSLELGDGARVFKNACTGVVVAQSDVR